MYGPSPCQRSGARVTLLGVRALRFVPPLAWTGLIAWLSSSGWSGEETGRLLLPLLRTLFPWLAPEQLLAFHWLIRKSAHVLEYAALAVLWQRAVGGRQRRAAAVALALCALTATADELHQATTTTRTGSPWDVALDTAGAAAALLLATAPGATIDVLIGALLWVAALGGLGLLALDLAVGVPSGWLWLSVPAAWLALVLRYRTGRR
jgi:VanZ family protein